MENKEAAEYLKKHEEALFEARMALDAKERLEKSIQEYRERLRQTDDELNKLKRKSYLNEFKIKVYEKECPGITIEVCGACGGEGGWSWSDEYGNGDGGICDACGGSGFIVEKKESK